PNDYITAILGSPSLGNMVVQSMNSDGSGPGSNFYNSPGGGATAPSLATIGVNPDAAHDTFLTIGVGIADQGSATGGGSPDGTMLAPSSFNGLGDVNQLDSNIAGWFTPGPFEQGRAGYLGDGDALLRVLIMQLTVSSTSSVRGTVNVDGVKN